jgi:hypothetical protein
MWPIILITLWAQLTAAQLDTAKAAYHKLKPAEIEAKKTTVQPPKDVQRVDVSERIRSASFGHKTFLLIAADGSKFWVEYGASTNAPAALYGPFSITPAK